MLGWKGNSSLVPLMEGVPPTQPFQRKMWESASQENFCCCCSVAVVSDSLDPQVLEHTRLLCPPLSPRVCSDSRPLSQRCYLTISSSTGTFSFCFQSFSALGSFPVSQLFCIRWPKYWSFRFSNSSSNDYSGLISFRID